jgi:uncharacterized protein (DUF1499 family)
MAPQGLCRQAKVDVVSPVYGVAAKKLRQEFLGVAISQKRVTHTFADEPGLYDDLIVRSAWFGFPDLVSIKFLDVKAGKSTFALYSRSVYGRSDLGVNRARSLAWLALVNSVIEPLVP